MSTYLSDIDLATLHKKRLDEKNLYKLSWYNRHDEFHHQPHLQHQTQTTIIEHKVKSKMEKVPKSRVNESQKPTVIRHQSTRATNDVNNAYRMSNGGTNIAIVSSSHHVLSGKRSPDYYDEGYLSEPTLSRRRSGTWP